MKPEQITALTPCRTIKLSKSMVGKPIIHNGEVLAIVGLHRGALTIRIPLETKRGPCLQSPKQ